MSRLIPPPRRLAAPARASPAAAPSSSGHLNPGDADVVFDRFELTPGFDELVRHVWVVRWSLRPGDVRTQRVLTYPAVNVVFQPDRAALYGPYPGVQERRLQGRSWAVGVLFRPAAARLLTSTAPAGLVAQAPEGEPMEEAPLEAVERIMSHGVGSNPSLADGTPREDLASVLQAWLGPVADRLDAKAMLLNSVCRVAEADELITRTSELAAQFSVSTRTLERLVRDGVGVTPKWLIECRRLQAAATRLFSGRAGELGLLAPSLGYADYAHFSRRYKEVLGETPDQTRRLGAKNPRNTTDPIDGSSSPPPR